MIEKAIIAAMTEDRVIGRDGALPWHLPEDLKNFKRITRGDTVLMGRRTYESLPDKFKPLPDRINLVLSRTMEQEPGMRVAESIDHALELAESYGRDLFIIGGESIYEQTLPLVDTMYISWVDGEYEGDTFFPEFNEEEWRECYRQLFENFNMVKYRREEDE